MAKSRVLLATGDEWIANLIGAVLRDAGLEVVESPTGAASIEVLSRDPVDAVVIDAALPDDAAELVSMLRKLPGPASAAAVMILAHADDSFSRMEALRAGADACLGRPFRADELGLQVLALIAMAHRCADAPRPRASFPSVATALRSPSLAPSSDGAALVGDLAQVSLPTMLSLLELERRSGTMSVQTPKQTVTLVMREGAAARATINGAATSIIAVLRRVLRWKVGRFEFRPDAPGPASVPPEEHSSIGALAHHEGDGLLGGLDAHRARAPLELEQAEHRGQGHLGQVADQGGAIG
ncbi:MAG: response regulator, partial [Myxococcales bacterium]